MCSHVLKWIHDNSFMWTWTVMDAGMLALYKLLHSAWPRPAI